MYIKSILQFHSISLLNIRFFFTAFLSCYVIVVVFTIDFLDKMQQKATSATL